MVFDKSGVNPYACFMMMAVQFNHFGIVQKLCAAFAALVWVGIARDAHARPVSYPGGWTVIGELNGFMASALVHYSGSARYSVGARMERRRVEELVFVGVQSNVLLKRWNATSSQANIYLTGGVGGAFAQSGSIDQSDAAAGFVGLSADWETRRYFAAYGIRHMAVDARRDMLRQYIRAGIAPYEGDYGDLHTWVMVQVDHRPLAPVGENKVVATPLLRFFKGATLLEVGYGTDERLLLNFIQRF